MEDQNCQIEKRKKKTKKHIYIYDSVTQLIDIKLLLKHRNQ